MKKIYSLFLICFYFLHANAQWQQTNGPLNGNIKCIVISGSNIFAGIEGGSDVNGYGNSNLGGVFLSKNNGNSWQRVNTGFGTSNSYSLTVSAMAISGQNIYAVPGLLYFSSNNGDTWYPTNCPVGPAALAIIGSNIFAAGGNSGVYLSSNNGGTWTVVDSGLPWNVNILSLAVSGANIYAGDPYKGEVYLSTNNGISWSSLTPISGGGAYPFINAIAVNGSDIFLGTDSGVYFSNNNGSTWNVVNNGLPSNVIVNTITINGNNIFAGTDSSGIFLSTNSGNSWTAINNGLRNLQIQALTISGSNIFAGTHIGIYLSINNGNNWTAVGVINSAVYALTPNGTNLFAGTGYYYHHFPYILDEDGQVYLSTNGNSWNAVNIGFPPDITVRALTTNDSNLFAGTDGRGVIMSNNNGSTWSLINTGIQDSSIYVLASNGTDVFTGGSVQGLVNTSVYISFNNGSTWFAADNGLSFDGIIYTLAANSTNIFAGTGSGLYHSNDNGSNWTKDKTIYGYIGASTALTVSNVNVYAGDGNGTIYASSDNGNTWTVQGWCSGGQINTLVVNEPNLFAGTSLGVFLSTNNGQTWRAINEGLTDTSVLSLAINGGNLYAGTYGDGVWHRALSNIVGIEEHNTDLKVLVSPNPSDGNFTLSYNIKSKGRLEIFSAEGRGVYNGEIEPGNTRKNIVLNNVADGIYFYKVTFQEGLSSGKLVIMK